MTRAYPDPADPSGDTTWPWPTSPQPSARMSLRVGHAPRLPRRGPSRQERFAVYVPVVVVTTAAGLGGRWWWTSAVAVLLLAATAVLFALMRPKQASPSAPAPAGAVLAVHPGPGALRRLRRPVTPLTPAA